MARRLMRVSNEIIYFLGDLVGSDPHGHVDAYRAEHHTKKVCEDLYNGITLNLVGNALFEKFGYTINAQESTDRLMILN